MWENNMTELNQKFNSIDILIEKILVELEYIKNNNNKQ